MRSFHAIVFLLALGLSGRVASAEESGTASTSTEAGNTITRVERRVLLKKNRFLLAAGVGWFARGDYYNNPGATASLTYYPIESGGVELRLAGFYSYLNAGAQEIFDRYQQVPDAQRPAALAMVGWRQSFGYGKLLLGSSPGSIVHFDLQATGRLGSVITTQAANPAASVGVAVLARISTFNLELDVPLVLSREITATRSVALGVLPTLSFGVSL